MSSLREKILKGYEFPSKLFESKSWDVKLKMVGLSRAELLALYAECENEKGDVDDVKFIPALVVACARDPLNDQRVLEKADIDTLNSQFPNALVEAYEAAKEVCGLVPKQVTEKNSVKTAGDAGPSV